MPICLNCGYNICFYTDNPDAHFIEKCWCGGYVVDRDLISFIIKKNKSLNRLMTVVQLNGKLPQREESQMATYAICQSLLEDHEIIKSLRDKGTDYLYKIVAFVIEHKK